MSFGEEIAYISKNFDGRVEFCGGQVIFDSVNGVGATGNNANVRYMGGAVLMLPSTFLALVAPLDDPRERTSGYLPTAAVNPGWGPPMLYLLFDKSDKGVGRVTGHEGRHRATAFARACPGALMMVHILPYGESFRARSLAVKLDRMRQGLIRERWNRDVKPNIVPGPLFDFAFVGDRIFTWDE